MYRIRHFILSILPIPLPLALTSSSRLRVKCSSPAIGQSARAAVSRPVTLGVAMRQVLLAIGISLVGVTVIAACGSDTNLAGSSKPQQVTERQADNALSEKSASNDPSISSAFEYRVVRAPADMTSVAAGIATVRVVDGGDDTVHALARRKDLQLARLHFHDAQVTDAGLLEVASLYSVNHLYFLRCSRITKVGVMALTAMPQLRSITVLQCAGIDGQDSDDLRAAMPNTVMFRDK
jgi:hypothetical protein